MRERYCCRIQLGEDEFWEHTASGDYRVVRWSSAMLDDRLQRSGLTVVWDTVRGRRTKVRGARCSRGGHRESARSLPCSAPVTWREQPAG